MESYSKEQGKQAADWDFAYSWEHFFKLLATGVPDGLAAGEKAEAQELLSYINDYLFPTTRNDNITNYTGNILMLPAKRYVERLEEECRVPLARYMCGNIWEVGGPKSMHKELTHALEKQEFPPFPYPTAVVRGGQYNKTKQEAFSWRDKEYPIIYNRRFYETFKWRNPEVRLFLDWHFSLVPYSDYINLGRRVISEAADADPYSIPDRLLYNLLFWTEYLHIKGAFGELPGVNRGLCGCMTYPEYSSREVSPFPDEKYIAYSALSRPKVVKSTYDPDHIDWTRPGEMWNFYYSATPLAPVIPDLYNAVITGMKFSTIIWDCPAPGVFVPSGFAAGPGGAGVFKCDMSETGGHAGADVYIDEICDSSPAARLVPNRTPSSYCTVEPYGSFLKNKTKQNKYQYVLQYMDRIFTALLSDYEGHERESEIFSEAVKNVAWTSYGEGGGAPYYPANYGEGMKVRYRRPMGRGPQPFDYMERSKMLEEAWRDQEFHSLDWRLDNDSPQPRDSLATACRYPYGDFANAAALFIERPLFASALEVPWRDFVGQKELWRERIVKEAEKEAADPRAWGGPKAPVFLNKAPSAAFEINAWWCFHDGLYTDMKKIAGAGESYPETDALFGPQTKYAYLAAKKAGWKFPEQPDVPGPSPSQASPPAARPQAAPAEPSASPARGAARKSAIGRLKDKLFKRAGLDAARPQEPEADPLAGAFEEPEDGPAAADPIGDPFDEQDDDTEASR